MTSMDAMHKYYAGQRTVAIAGALVSVAYLLVAWAAFLPGDACHALLRYHGICACGRLHASRKRRVLFLCRPAIGPD